MTPQIFIGTVSYLDYDNDIMEWGNMFLPFLVKRRAFDHEREVRAVMWLPPNRLVERNGNGYYVDVDLDTLIDDIVVSSAAPDYSILRLSKRSVINTVSINLLPDPVFHRGLRTTRRTSKTLRLLLTHS